jgi:hypothetical protein
MDNEEISLSEIYFFAVQQSSLVLMVHPKCYGSYFTGWTWRQTDPVEGFVENWKFLREETKGRVK